MAVTTSAQQILRNAGLESDTGLPEEFCELVNRYRSELVNQAFAILGNVEDAEDVVQETFCEAFRDKVKLAQARSLGAWLRSINRDNALDRMRGKKRESNRTIKKKNESKRHMVTTGGFSTLEMRDLVANAVDGLNDKTRAVVVLCYWEHLSLDEIAQRLQISSRTVRRLLFEASTHLYGKLEVCLSDAIPPQSDAPKRSE